MTTTNISLPDKLKTAADKLVKSGHYASFSDLVRHALRQALTAQTYDQWADQAVSEHKQNKTKALKSNQDIDNFIESL